MMKDFVAAYLDQQQQTQSAISQEKVTDLIGIFHQAWKEDRRIFVVGNGGSAANASHFATDLGKSASDNMGKPFKVVSLHDNTPWITAISNDYAYDQIFVRQLINFAQPGDILFAMSVSGNSPNVVNAVEWGKKNGLYSVCLTGAQLGRLAELGDFVISIESKHFGRVEDAHMGICHMICYAFVEHPGAFRS
ncbi:SIS domain-containing protein [Pollutibacter soli]|uniref:D-sedoheptulose-7-phosphate isomerase n=1 Tax=Pollutibacter soli TaxID=3034157 RepID=UPI00301364E7